LRNTDGITQLFDSIHQRHHDVYAKPFCEIPDGKSPADWFAIHQRHHDVHTMQKKIAKHRRNRHQLIHHHRHHDVHAMQKKLRNIDGIAISWFIIGITMYMQNILRNTRRKLASWFINGITEILTGRH
jgi:hypothetical protein